MGVPVDENKVRARRKALGLTQEALEEASGVNVRTIRRAESGARIWLSKLRRLATALKTTEADLQPSRPAAPTPTPAAATTSVARTPRLDLAELARQQNQFAAAVASSYNQIAAALARNQAQFAAATTSATVLYDVMRPSLDAVRALEEQFAAPARAMQRALVSSSAFASMNELASLAARLRF